MRHLSPFSQNTTGVSSIDSLLLALQRVDRMIEQAMDAMPTAYATEAATDPYRGLYISRDEVEQLLSRQPGAPTLQFNRETAGEPSLNPVSDVPQLIWLQQTFNLSPFDLDLILIALAPELDLRYERLYAYLQDDITRKCPTVDLALNLLCHSATAKLIQRAHFAPNAPLISQGLLHLIPDPNQLQSPLLAHYLKLDDQLVRLLLSQEGVDLRLAPFCHLTKPTVSLQELPLNSQIKQALGVLAVQHCETHQPLHLYFQGPHDTSKRLGAEAIANQLEMSLLTVHLPQLLEIKTDFARILNLLFREAWFQNAVLYLDGFDSLTKPEHALFYQYLIDMLGEDGGITIISGTQSWIPVAHSRMDILSVLFAIPDFTQRRTHWQTHLAQVNISIASSDIDALADRFHLTLDQIANAVTTACNNVRWRVATQSGEPPAIDADAHSLSVPQRRLTTADLFAAARMQSSHDLTTLARKIQPNYAWDDIVLSSEQFAQLRELCDRMKYHHVVYGKWGFERKLSLGKGLNALFSGPPGTGKTMAAEVIANELQLDLYKIDLSQIVSKYIGETEKNLDRIFSAAQSTNAILFFDEADALFGKRSDVKDAHDRYANIEVGYLLQKMEEYEGVAILATNLRQNMDDAFVRRLHFIVEFPFPDEESRQRIWQVIFPKEAPIGEDVDFDFLAKEVRLAGGNIKNIGLAAAFYAAGEDGIIQMSHLLKAALREHQKLGRTWHVAEQFSHHNT